MTLKRGMRRLALFLGVLGAITGGFASYVGLQPLIAQRTRHKKFEQLANMDVVQRQRKLLTISQSLRVGDPIPPGGTIGEPTTSTMPPAPPPGYSASDVVSTTVSTPIPPPPDNSGIVDDPFYTPTLNKSGIEKINWTKNDEIESIETTDGALYFPESAPSAWQYSFILTFPMLGFLIPWGFVSALVWVGTGFFDSSKERNEPS